MLGQRMGRAQLGKEVRFGQYHPLGEAYCRYGKIGFCKSQHSA
jgi:hypothetical protein